MSDYIPEDEDAANDNTHGKRKRPHGNPPTFLGFAFHLGRLVRPGYIRLDFETGAYGFMDNQYANMQRIQIARFWGISYRYSWILGFMTIAKITHETENRGELNA